MKETVFPFHQCFNPLFQKKFSQLVVSSCCIVDVYQCHHTSPYKLEKFAIETKNKNNKIIINVKNLPPVLKPNATSFSVSPDHVINASLAPSIELLPSSLHLPDTRNDWLWFVFPFIHCLYIYLNDHSLPLLLLPEKIWKKKWLANTKDAVKQYRIVT